MANTIVEFAAYEGQTLTAFLTARTGATGTPAASYACTEVDDGQYRFTVPEALVGEFDLAAQDGDSVLAARQHVQMLDDALIHRCYDFTDRKDVNDTLALIKAKTDLLGTGDLVLIAPVTDTGAINPLFIGDDYNAANGRALEWEFDAISGFVVGTAVAKFGLNNPEDDENSVIITGTVADIGGGQWKATIEIDQADTQDLVPGCYDWSVEIVDGGEEVTIASNGSRKSRVELRAKQT